MGKSILVVMVMCVMVLTNFTSVTTGSIELGTRRPATPAEAKQLQEKTASELGIPIEKDVVLNKTTSMAFILIPAGEFYMGSPKSEKGRDGDEGPVHYVKISKPFYMGKYEVTQAQYDCLMGRRKYFTYYFQGYNRPVERTSLNHANNFLHELTLLYSESGLRFRLPTEAEWEYACRAGTTTPFYTGETINDKQANYKAKKVYGKGVKGTYLMRTTDVGSYPPNAFGLYDMHGNVWEWCNDMYMKKYYRSSPTTDPVGGGGDEPVRRGGAWDAKPKDCRSADRHHIKLWRHKDNTGFRAVLEIDETEERNKAETLIPEKNIAATDPNETIQKSRKFIGYRAVQQPDGTLKLTPAYEDSK